jgi:ankyrin repeat protein
MTASAWNAMAGGTALVMAARAGHADKAELLLGSGADVNARMHPLYRRTHLAIARTKGY